MNLSGLHQLTPLLKTPSPSKTPMRYGWITKSFFSPNIPEKRGMLILPEYLSLLIKSISSRVDTTLSALALNLEDITLHKWLPQHSILRPSENSTMYVLTCPCGNMPVTRDSAPSTEQTWSPIARSLFSFHPEGVDTLASILRAFPMEGLAAIITKFPGCQPLVILFRS